MGGSKMAIDFQPNSIAELLQRGIAAASEKDKPTARALLREVVTKDPGNEQGWLWLAAVAASPEEALLNFQRVLAINPNNQQALAGMRWAEARRRRTSQLQTQTALTSPPPAATPSPAMGGAPLPASLEPSNRYAAPPTTPVTPVTMPAPPPLASSGGTSAASRPRVAEPDVFFTPPSASSTASPRITEPDAFFTSPAWVTPSAPPSNEPGIDMAGLQRITDSRRAPAQQPPSSRQGFFDIGDEGETPRAANSAVLGDSTALPTPAAATVPEGYDDSFDGMDDLANVDETGLPDVSRLDEAKPAPRRERSVNLARQLAMEGAALDQKAGQLEANAEDATSIEAAHDYAARRRTNMTTTRAASPGLFSSPLLVGAALLVVLVAIGLIAFTMMNNSGGQPDVTIINFMSAYNKGDAADYGNYLTPAMQKQMSSDASIQSYLTAYQKDMPAGTVDSTGKITFNTTLQKIADDSTSGKTRAEYYLYGKSAQSILDFGLEKSGNGWLIDYIGWLGGKLYQFAVVLVKNGWAR
jgi:hypothetical protein